MKKILFLCFCVFCFAEESQYHGAVVDQQNQSRDGNVFGQLPQDGMQAMQDASQWAQVFCPASSADCSMEFMNNMQTWTERTSTNLAQLHSRWELTNERLDRIIQIAKELPIAQRNALVMEETKLLKLKELSFNLQKAFDLQVPQIEILQNKKSLQNEILTK